MDAKELKKKLMFHIHQMFGGIQEIFDQGKGWDTDTAKQYQEYMIDTLQKTTESYHQAKSKEEAEERYCKARDKMIKDLGGISVYEKMLLRIASGKV